jgi:AcrR family transcriptional regulator
MNEGPASRRARPPRRPRDRPAARRPTGRPAVRHVSRADQRWQGHPPQTASALLDSARELFARKGYAGASIREITRRARANLGAVTYHFGSKEALFNAVVAAAIAQLRERILAAASSPGAPVDRLERIVRGFFDHFAQCPELPRLILHVLASGRTPPPAAANWAREASGILSGLVREGQRDGSIREGDPLLMAVSVVSQPLYLALARLPLREFVAIDQDDPASRARIADNAASFVRHALAAPERTRRGSRSPASGRRPS